MRQEVRQRTAASLDFSSSAWHEWRFESLHFLLLLLLILLLRLATAQKAETAWPCVWNLSTYSQRSILLPLHRCVSDGRNTGCPTILLFFLIFEMFIVGQPVVSLLTLSLSPSLSFIHSFKKKTAMFLPLVVVVGGGAPPAVEPHASCGGNYGWMRTETPWAGKACPPPQWEPSWVTVVSLLTLSLSLSLFSLSLNDHILSLCLYIASFSRHLCGSISTVHTFILDHGLLVLPLYRTRTLLPCYRRN